MLYVTVYEDKRDSQEDKRRRSGGDDGEAEESLDGIDE